MRILTSVTAAAAVVITSIGFAAVPAEARHRGGYYYRHRDRVDAGDVIGGILLIGTIAAIASAAGKDRSENRRDRYDPPYRDDQRRYEPRYDDAPRDDGMGYRAAPGSIEARVVDACSWAVEGELGGDGRVERIDSVTDERSDWRVTGTASGRADTSRFSCTYRNGRVIDVRVD